ncbi:MAG: tetratricopeptide repeat protein [Spirochaetales bacterium]|nr:tetratricopeptide repeat protein [Spirochaetales bacterium]
MAPKAIVYKANSIIYFKGDISDKIFILNQGKVSLNFTNIETGQEMHELIKTGEFFGVKSSMGRYPREETALVLQDSKVIAFSVPEFEQLVSKNTRVIIKMLQVFSNQLRRIHKQVKNLMYIEDTVNAETGLFRLGEYYLKAKKYNQAIYAFNRYLVYYPSGGYSDNATKNIYMAEEFLQQYGQGKGPDFELDSPKEIRKPDQPKQTSATEKLYYQGVNLLGQAQYQEASKIFHQIIKDEKDSDFTLKAQFEIGKCLFHLAQYSNCIKVYSALLQRYPKHPDLNEALYYIGVCNEKNGDYIKASSVYRKVLSLTPEADPLFKKVYSALKALEKD